jgi:hypothetical protein
MIVFFAIALLAIVLGSALTIQLFVLPVLIARITDRSAVTRVSMQVLKGHHSLSVVLLIVATILFVFAKNYRAAGMTGFILAINLYQRFWIFTKLHLVKQPIGVQDLIQPDNVLREEFNRLHSILYWIFRVHIILLFVDLLLAIL